MPSPTTLHLTLEVTLATDAAGEALAATLEKRLNSAIQAGMLDFDSLGEVTGYDTAIDLQDKARDVQVRHWAAEDRDRQGIASRAFTSEVRDDRSSTGQLQQAIRLGESPQDRVGTDGLDLDVLTEINNLHGDDTDYPCLHIGVEDENRLSIFRRADGLVLRPDTDSALESITLPCGSPAWRIR